MIGRLTLRLALAAILAAPLVLMPAPVQAAPSAWLAVDGNIRFQPAGGATVDWANSGLPAPVAVCASSADINLNGTGGLFNCGHANAAPAPPSAPSLTPAAAADQSLISSSFIVDPIASDSTSCGVGDPTTFSGAVKNSQDLNGISFGPGPVPAKDDLGNVYALSHTRSADGRPELFFAAERLVNNGDSHIDFEFLQTPVAVSTGCSGTFSGHRSEGDLLVTVDFTNGGALANYSLYQWHCVAEPGPQPADGTVCDPTAPAPHYQSIAIPGAVSLIVNSADIPCGGWVCRDQVTGTSLQVAANDFMEGGIDLSSLNFTGCVHTFLPHTRTAQSFDATLKDFAGPTALATCRTPAMVSASSPSGSTTPSITTADSLTVSGFGPIVPAGSVTFFLCGPTQVVASGCPTGGTPVGAPKPLSAGGTATSDSTANTNQDGRYCWRAEYTPAAGSLGIYDTSSHTNATAECFSVSASTPPISPSPFPGPPDAGRARDPQEMVGSPAPPEVGTSLLLMGLGGLFLRAAGRGLRRRRR